MAMMGTDSMPINERIRQARLSQDLTQVQVARKIGSKQPAVSMFEAVCIICELHLNHYF